MGGGPGWSSIRRCFERAIAVEGEARRDLLARAEEVEPGIRARVEALLAADSTTGGPLETPIAETTFRVLAGQTLAGRRFGPYRLLREIGRGGMGTIYLARCDDGAYEAEVAIKLVRPGLDDAAILRRFEQERQILANVAHPNIARLLDAGVADLEETESGIAVDGRPYVVMEHVIGEPIDRYCDANGLSLARRLTLFRAVCRAVHAAHCALVVHCDLKPSNILVTAEGEVKLLDFGISRLLDDTDVAEPTDDSAAPSSEPGPLTPEFASPEQIRGEPLTTATDVYSLGVVLYRLLTGVGPYPRCGGDHRQVAKAVLETMPPAPSEAVSTAPARRRLTGDLDAITRKAMAKRAESRYETVLALAEDLERHRDARPVLARPSRAGYRARKFLRRHWLATAAAALLALSLVGGSVATAVQAAEARRRGFESERSLAFLVEIFDVAAPDRGNAALAPIRELLDRGVANLDRAFADDALSRARLLDTIGEVYRQLGEVEKAAPLLESALGLRRDNLRTPHRDIATSLGNLGQLRLEQEAYAEARALLEESSRMRRRLFGDDHPQVAESLFQLGQLAYRQGELALAESCHRRALALRRDHFGDHPKTAESLNSLGAVIHDRDGYQEAEALYTEALAIRRSQLGDDHWRVASTLNNLASLDRELGRDSEAVARYRQALAIQRRSLGTHPSLARTLNNLGVALNRLGEFAESESAFREAIALMVELYGEDHTDVATFKANFADVLLENGESEAAEAMIRQALDRHRAVLGADHATVARDLKILSDIERATGRLAAAKSSLGQALEIERRRLTPGHRRIASTLLRLGRIERDDGACDAAEPLLRESWTIRRGHRLSARLLAGPASALAECLVALSRHADAAAVLDDTLAGLSPTERSGAHAARLEAQLASIAGSHSDSQSQ